MPLHWRRWTQQELDVVEDYMLDGASPQETADEVNRRFPSSLPRTAVAILRIAHRLAIPIMDERRREWLELLGSSLPVRQIAERMGVTMWAVKKMRTRLRKKQILGWQEPAVEDESKGSKEGSDE